MAKVTLSADADADLLAIGREGRERWGIEQAIAYLSSFDDTFQFLAQFPAASRKRDEVQRGLRSRRHESHIVFYVVKRGDVHIVRILHTAQNAYLIDFEE